jgi:hypothetical protein
MDSTTPPKAAQVEAEDNDGADVRTKRTKKPKKNGQANGSLRWRHWLSIAVVSGLVSIFATGTGLIWAVHPAWKPDPGEKQLAEASIVVVDKGVPSGDFADRIGIGKGALDRCLPGNVYYVRQNLQGFKDRDTSLLYRSLARNGRTLSGNVPTSLTTPHSRTDDQQVNAVWVEWPYQRAAYFVRFQIWRKKTMLAVVDSPRFKVNQVKFNDFVTRCVNRK